MEKELCRECGKLSAANVSPTVGLKKALFYEEGDAWIRPSRPFRLLLFAGLFQVCCVTGWNQHSASANALSDTLYRLLYVSDRLGRRFVLLVDVAGSVCFLCLVQHRL